MPYDPQFGSIPIKYNSDTYFATNAAVATVGATTVRTVAAGKMTMLRYAELYNATGGAITVGLGKIVETANWIAGQWDDGAGGSDFTDDTTDAQDAGADDFALTGTGAGDDGYVIGATEIFSMVRFTIGVAEAGAPTYAYDYWNGSAWSTLTLVDTPTYTNDSTDEYLTFVPPSDWTALASAEEGIPAGNYAIRCKATTSPSTAPLVTIMYVSHPFAWLKKAPTVASVTWNLNDAVLSLNAAGEDLIAYFGSANAGNRVMLIGDDV